MKVFTSGTQGLDFQIVSGGNTTCSSSTVSGTTCAVEVSFLPTAPGLRNGQLVLYEPGSNPVLTVPLYGFGDAPVAALSPNTGSVINTGGLTLSDPFQVALDGAGNIYVGNYSTTNVTKIPAGGGSAVLVNLGTPGDIAPQSITGVAIDGAGNLFIGDHINSRILVVTPGGVVSVLTINGLSTALELPTALAFDASGALYIADYGSGRIVEVSSIQVTGSTSTGIATVINTGSYSFGISTLSGVTVDRQGTLYAAARTQNNSSIIKITASGIVSAVAIPNNITPAISGPQGLTTDAMGNLYIVDSGNNRMVKITTAGVASVLGLSGLPSPSSLGSSIFGVTVDPSGNVYIPDWSNNRLVFVNVSGSALTYANTNQGQTSSDSPRTATVTNLGNEPLVFSTNPTYTANFSNNGNDTNPCTSSTSLSSGTACDLSINFTPQSAGSLSAGITVTDNTLNVATSTQQVSVSGTGIASGDTTSTTLTLSPTSLANGQAVTMTATVADTTTVSHTPTGSVTFTDTVGSTIVSLGPATLSGGVGTKTGVQLSGIGSHTITASYAGVGGTFIASTTTATVALSKAPVTLAGPVAQPVLVTIGQASSAVITVSGPYTTIAAPGGALTYSILNSSNVSVASGSLTLAAGETSSTATVPLASTLASGAYTISGNYGGDSNYLPSSAPVTITVTVSATAPTITWNPSATSIVYGANLGGILDATASYGDSTVPGTFAYTAASGASPFAVLAGTILSAATYTLTATFTPTNTTNYAVVHRSITLLVTKAAATISWIPGATSITYGASLSSILNATASNGSSTVAGIFAYTATLSGGSPVVVVAGTILAAGSYMLTATFTPTDTTDFTAAPSSITLVVSKATATISWSPGATSITYGAGLSGILDATASSGSTTVAGTFAYTAAASGASPFAILAGTILPAGTYTLTATFTPTDTTDFAAAPSSITLIVIKATPAISWNPGATSISYGANLSSILDATALSGGSTIAGTVAYTAAASGASPVAVVAGTILAVGSYTLTATFTPSNSTSYGTALSSITLTVSKAVAAISLTSSSSTVAPGIAIVFTAAVSSSVGTPTGAVSFSDGTGLLATVALSGGTAAYSTSSLAAGAQSITASYSGDNNFAPSTSSAIIETVQDFNLTLASSSPGGATQTVVPGGTATYDLAIGPSSGPTFPAAISLTVSGLPPGATATISPQVLPAGSGLSNVTLTIVLAKTTAALGGGDGLSRRLAPMLLGILVLPFAVRIRRTGARFGRMVCALVVVMAGCGLVAGLSGCGSSSSGFFGQAPQSYSVIITGTSGSISHSTTVVLVIQ